MNWYKKIKISYVTPDFNDYESFKNYYLLLLKEMFKYKSDQVGSQIFAEKLGELVDKYPEYEKIIDEDINI